LQPFSPFGTLFYLRIPMKLILPILSAIIALPLAAQSTVAYTTPAGYVKSNLVAGFNPLGVNLHGQILVSGVIDSESGAVITDADVDFASALNDTSATYVFEVTSGPQDGSVSIIDQNVAVTANTVTLEGAGISAGAESYTIRQARTLNEIFGTGSNGQLQGGISPLSADVVWLPDGSGGYDQYFHRNGANEFRPTTAAGTALTSPVSIFYPDGIFIQIRSNPKTVTIFGEVKTTPTISGIIEGFNLISNSSPVGCTLAESGLDQFIKTGPSPLSSDIVWVPDNIGGYTQYFYRSLNSSWRLTTAAGGADQGATILPSAVFIQRRGATSAAGQFLLPPFFSTL